MALRKNATKMKIGRESSQKWDAKRASLTIQKSSSPSPQHSNRRDPSLLHGRYWSSSSHTSPSKLMTSLYILAPTAIHSASNPTSSAPSTSTTVTTATEKKGRQEAVQDAKRCVISYIRVGMLYFCQYCRHCEAQAGRTPWLKTLTPPGDLRYLAHPTPPLEGHRDPTISDAANIDFKRQNESHVESSPVPRAEVMLVPVKDVGKRQAYSSSLLPSKVIFQGSVCALIELFGQAALDIMHTAVRRWSHVSLRQVS